MGCADAPRLIPCMAHAEQGLIERLGDPRCRSCLVYQLEERQGKVVP